MFELKYKITDGDLKAINKSIMWIYFIPYLGVAVIGMVAGICATALRPTTVILVLGIILIVLGAILLVCSVLLAITPKCFVVSALLTSDEVERNVRFGDANITVVTEGQSDIIFGYGEIYKVKNNGDGLALYIGREQVLLVKNAFVGEGSIDELKAFISAKLGAPVAPSEKKEQAKEDNAEETKEEVKEEIKEEVKEDAPAETAGEEKAEDAAEPAEEASEEKDE